MSDLPMGAVMKCEDFLETLEELPVNVPGAGGAAEWLALLPEAARGHVAQCASCEGAWQDFVETRSALTELKEGLPEPGPWFTARVMATIRAQENEIEERKNGVWISVRRLAPRLAAFAAVLLVLAGTWALELRRAENTRQREMRPVEGLFETAPSAQMNDDIVASTYEERQP
jgi:hypothetical protein